MAALLPYWLGALALKATAGWLAPDVAVRLPFALMLAGTLAILMYYIHGIFKRKNKSKNTDVKYLRDLPDDSSPALVGGVMTKSVNDNEILATIVDLIRRKVLTLETSDKNTIIKQEFGDQRALTRRNGPQGSTGRGGQYRTSQQDAQADGHELQQAAALAARHDGARTYRAPPRRSGAGCRKVSICAQDVHEADSGARAGPAPWRADEWMERSAGCRVPAGGLQASGARHPTRGTVRGADANHGKRVAAPPSALPVDDGPAQANIPVVKDDGLAEGDSPLRLCKAHLDA